MSVQSTSLPAAEPAAARTAAPRLTVVPLRRAASPVWTGRALLAATDLLTVLAMVTLVGGAGLVAWSYALVAYAALATAGSYRPRLTLRLLDETPSLVGRLGAAVLLVGPLVGLAGGDAASLPLQAAGTVAGLLASRGLTYGAIRRARARRVLAEPTVIVGGGEIASELYRLLESRPEHGLVPVGFVNDGRGALPGPRLGGLEHLDAVIDDHQVRRVIVAFSQVREHELVGVVRAALLRGVDVLVVPRFFDVSAVPVGADVDDVWGIPLYRLRGAALHAPGWRMKRAFDVIASAAALAIVAPVMLLVALAVRITSPGPVLFRQRRVGQDGREFDVLKFRTLQINDDSDTTWSVVGDDRQTPIGRLLRRTSLDELPQLWNVLRGDMSLVGPRPERPYFAERFSDAIPGYWDRHRVPGGLTGWAQVHGLRGNTSIAERARFDNHYIDRWSPWRDIVILLRTLSAVVRNGEREAGSGDVADPVPSKTP